MLIKIAKVFFSFKENNLLVSDYKTKDSIVAVLSEIKMVFSYSSQPANTCSKLAIEILEQGVKYVQS